MSEPEGNVSRVVEVLQSPKVVVTFRAVVGVLLTITGCMVGWFGTNILDTQKDTNQTLNEMKVLQGRAALVSEFQETRLRRVEDKVDTIDNRVTRMEASNPDRYRYENR